MKDLNDRTPIIVGVGEITHRSKNLATSLEPLELMVRAMRCAESDAGVPLLRDLDSLDVVSEYSWPYADAPTLLASRLDVDPQRRVYGEAGGESPVRFIHDAALRIARGASRIAAVTGAESRYTVEAAKKQGVELAWTPRDDSAKLVWGPDFTHSAAAKLGAALAVAAYPLYENAALAHWGQTPREAMTESAQLWSRYSAIAASNPHAWLQRCYTPDEIADVSPMNRRIAWPYTKHMVANPMVNMGAAVLLTSVGHARTLGIAPDRWVYVWDGAAAKEPRDFTQRDQFHGSHAQDLVMEFVLDQVGGQADVFEVLELYSCFPIVPKMARRTLGLAPDAQMTSTGGLSFFGAPLNNYMTHAAAGLVRALRQAPGKTALLYGQGEYVTKHHALILGSAPSPRGLPREDYSMQAAVDRRRGPVPPFLTSYGGPATLETFTVLYGAGGEVKHGIVIGRTPTAERFMAKVDAADTGSLETLTSLDRSPVGLTGHVTKQEGDVLTWRMA
jgi:acetyl-CoA C-acetyltransferase